MDPRKEEEEKDKAPDSPAVQGGQQTITVQEISPEQVRIVDNSKPAAGPAPAAAREPVVETVEELVAEDPNKGLESQKAASDPTIVVPSAEPEASSSVGAIPKSLRTCYICRELYGSQSIKIHEPQCLEKWRLRNEALPPEQRAPEPVGPASSGGSEEGSDDDGSAPQVDPIAEAAYKRHQSNLIPCRHCSRTFSPGRVQKHESCCIDRPRSGIRDCITPADGEIPR